MCYSIVVLVTSHPTLAIAKNIFFSQLDLFQEMLNLAVAFRLYNYIHYNNTYMHIPFAYNIQLCMN